MLSHSHSPRTSHRTGKKRSPAKATTAARKKISPFHLAALVVVAVATGLSLAAALHCSTKNNNLSNVIKRRKWIRSAPVAVAAIAILKHMKLSAAQNH